MVRATSAVPTCFSASKIEGKSFIDGGVGTNNPTSEALSEIQEARSDSSLKPLIVSFGSGLRPQDNMRSNLPYLLRNSITTTIKALQATATNTEDVHKDMKRTSEFHNIDYFRFNVESGLEDILLDSWRVKKVSGRRVFETIETITLKTEVYLQRQDVAEKLRQCAQILVNRQFSTPSLPQSTSAVSTIPFVRDPGFVGREEILHKIDAVFSSQQRAALVGIGGIG